MKGDGEMKRNVNEMFREIEPIIENIFKDKVEIVDGKKTSILTTNFLMGYIGSVLYEIYEDNSDEIEEQMFIDVVRQTVYRKQREENSNINFFDDITYEEDIKYELNFYTEKL